MRRLGCVAVVLVLLLGFGVYATTSYNVSNKCKSDAVQLMLFANKLSRAINHPKNHDALNGNNHREYESFQVLVSSLFAEGTLRIEGMKNLAGTSGTATDERGYLDLARLKQNDPVDSEYRDACIFTGPKDFATLKRLTNCETPNCVMLCYNEDWIDYYKPERVIVCVLAGETRGRDLTLIELVELFPDSDLARRYNAGEEIDLLTVYGKTPFQHISPK